MNIFGRRKSYYRRVRHLLSFLTEFLYCFLNFVRYNLFLRLSSYDFSSIDMTKDLRLFDIKQLKQSEEKARGCYRLRKGKYRAIFYIEKDDIFVITVDKRDEVYKKWL